MLRDECLVTARHADRVLEVAADRQHRGPRRGEPDCARRVATRAPDELQATVDIAMERAHHAVVATDDDVAVVHQEGVGDTRQPRTGLIVARHQRLAARIRAGHHQYQRLRSTLPARIRRPSGGLEEQQVVQWRVRQHDAEPGQARRDSGQHRVHTGLLAQKDDRPLGRGQHRPFGGRGMHEPLGRSRVGHHHRQRLFLARLALTQPRDRRRIARVAGQVETAQPLDGDDLAPNKPRERLGHRVDIRDRGRVGIEHCKARTAGRARVGFGVETAVERIPVFSEAARALVERRHAGGCAIVR